MPARPPRSSVGQDNSDTTPISKTTSAGSAGSGDVGDDRGGVTSPPPAPKTKPVLPSRLVGSKIASLKAGFLSDLDKRLQVGPQGPKPQETTPAENEVTAEKAPLVDTRKGRPRGPARRKPAASSTPIAEGLEQEETVAKGEWSIQEPWTVWHTKDDGTLNVGQAINTAPPVSEIKHEPSKTTSTSVPLSINAVQDQEVAALDATNSKSENYSAPDLPAGGDQATMDQDSNVSFANDTTSKESSIKEFTPSSSPSPTVQPIADEVTQTTQAGEKAITVNPGTTEEAEMTVKPGEEAQGIQNPIFRE